MNKDLANFWELLKQQRDELRIRALIAKAELQEEWAVLEQKWQKAEKQIFRLQDDAIESTTEMKQAAQIIMEEISRAYKHFKERLHD